MNNEEIVVQIQQGVNVSENTLKLYQNNLPIIKMIIRPYTEYEEEADLLQESYFSLIKAIEKFDASMGYKFTTDTFFKTSIQIQGSKDLEFFALIFCYATVNGKDASV